MEPTRWETLARTLDMCRQCESPGKERVNKITIKHRNFVHYLLRMDTLIEQNLSIDTTVQRLNAIALQREEWSKIAVMLFLFQMIPVLL